MRLSRPILLVSVAALVLVIAGAAALLLRPYQFSGLLEDPPRPAPDLALTDQNSQPFALSQLRGEWVLLTFGYTTCPDVCPVTLAHLRQTREMLGDAGSEWRVVFASVDPARDTPEVLAGYLPHFGPDLIGLTGTEAEVATAAAAYGVQYEKRDLETAVGYLVNHSAFTYVIDPNFQLVLTIPFGARSEEIARDLTELMARESRSSP
jgi:protein SCO1/2